MLRSSYDSIPQLTSTLSFPFFPVAVTSLHLHFPKVTHRILLRPINKLPQKFPRYTYEWDIKSRFDRYNRQIGRPTSIPGNLYFFSNSSARENTYNFSANVLRAMDPREDRSRRAFSIRERGSLLGDDHF